MHKHTDKLRPYVTRKMLDSLVQQELLGKDGDKYISYLLVDEDHVKDFRNPRPHPTMQGVYIVEDDFNPDDWPLYIISGVVDLKAS